MTTTPAKTPTAPAAAGALPVPTAGAADLVTCTIDGVEVSVPKGTLIIRAAEEAGIAVPRFCDHPGLDPVGACRQCLVEVWMPGPPGPDGAPGDARQMQGPPGRMKPQASCTMTVAPGMVVKTQHTSEAINKAQQGVMELLLINHPLDCPVCDKGGECPLQNQAMSNGRPTSRFEDVKRTYPKPINISAQVLLDRERCVLCARCTRFSDQVAGDPFIALVERGALQQVGIYEEQPFESYFSGNTVQICPVGALTGSAYRFRSRPFDLVSTPTTCAHCASGCALRTDHRRGTVLRQMASNDPAVNEEWNCDKGRWAFTSATTGDRIEFPMVRRDGQLVVTSWPEALEVAAQGLAAATTSAVLSGGRVTVEDAYAYGKFARTVLRTNNLDFRTRPHSREEADFLAAAVVGTGPEGGAVTYADLETASSVLLVGFEPEDESPIVFLRLRKAFRRSRTAVYAVSPLATRGLAKVGGRLIATAPGTEPEVLGALAAGSSQTPAVAAASAALRAAGAIILVGERMALVPGALSAVATLATQTGARLAWVPRRAGERGALEAGMLPGLLPGGRPATDEHARAEVAAAWGVGSLPVDSGRDAADIIDGARDGSIDALIVGGVDLADAGVGDVADVLTRPFVVSLEVRRSAVTEHADVVFPVATHAEKAGRFVNWEGRIREVQVATPTNALSDFRVLDLLAGAMGHWFGARSVDEVAAEMTALGPWAGARALAPTAPAADVPDLDGVLALANWRHLLDAGSMQDGEPFLAGTAPAPVAKLSAATAAALDVSEGDEVVVTAGSTVVRAPVAIADMADHVVWLPTHSTGCDLRAVNAQSPASQVVVTKGSLA